MDKIVDLHDATFTTLEVDWASGELRFNFKTHTGVVCLRAHRFSDLKCPRLYPWGRSKSVNTATTESRERGLWLMIEMQSGDVIEACVEDVVVERQPANLANPDA